MNFSPAIDRRSRHPLSGIESWPKTGPVYGFAEDDTRPEPSFWERLGEKFGRVMPVEPAHAPIGRVWY